MSRETVDETDLELLQLLKKDGRATYADMAAAVSLSVAAVKRRVDRLRRIGVITAFTVQIDHAKLGWDVSAFAEIRYPGTITPEEMIATMTKVPEVHAVHTLAGDPDVIAELRARDHTHLQDVLTRLRRSSRAIGTKTLIVLGGWRREQ